MRFSVIRGRFDKITVRALLFVPVQPFLPSTPLPDANLGFRYLWARTGPTSHQQSRPGHWSVISWCANSGDIVAEQPFLICSQFKIGTRPFRPVKAIESQNPHFCHYTAKKLHRDNQDITKQCNPHPCRRRAVKDTSAVTHFRPTKGDSRGASCMSMAADISIVAAAGADHCTDPIAA